MLGASSVCKFCIKELGLVLPSHLVTSWQLGFNGMHQSLWHQLLLFISLGHKLYRSNMLNIKGKCPQKKLRIFFDICYSQIHPWTTSSEQRRWSRGRWSWWCTTTAWRPPPLPSKGPLGQSKKTIMLCSWILIMVHLCAGTRIAREELWMNLSTGDIWTGEILCFELDSDSNGKLCTGTHTRRWQQRIWKLPKSFLRWGLDKKW